ncbi:hypothetical protein ES705_19710 [subsurface metagenome]
MEEIGIIKIVEVINDYVTAEGREGYVICTRLQLHHAKIPRDDFEALVKHNIYYSELATHSVTKSFKTLEKAKAWYKA